MEKRVINGLDFDVENQMVSEGRNKCPVEVSVGICREFPPLYEYGFVINDFGNVIEDISLSVSDGRKIEVNFQDREKMIAVLEFILKVLKEIQ